jgi:glutathione synthase/RimK-type ligase-like ATP-grasp enzyme
MRRRGTSWRTNFSQGAVAEAIELTDDMNVLAVRAARLIGLDYAGVDILPAENGKNYVVEINSIPGWRGLQKTTDLKIAETIVAHVCESARDS